MKGPSRTASLLSGPLFKTRGEPQPLFFIDTSTLIYLDKIAVLSSVCQVFAVVTIRSVFTEFGREIDGIRILPDTSGSSETDAALFSMVCRYNGVLLSEDGSLLRRAERRGLPYYNSLMLVCGLCHHGVLDCREGARRIDELMAFARYGKNVRTHGGRVFAQVCGQRHAAGENKEKR